MAKNGKGIFFEPNLRISVQKKLILLGLDPIPEDEYRI